MRDPSLAIVTAACAGQPRKLVWFVARLSSAREQISWSELSIVVWKDNPLINRMRSKLPQGYLVRLVMSL